MTKHTPGPWLVGGPYPGVSVIYPVGCDDSGEQFELITRLWDWEHGDAPEEVKSNANLIAAAPELLEACEAAYHSDKYSLPPKTRVALKNAIAKARGES